MRARLTLRESPCMSIDREAVLAVAGMRDPGGVVSIYVDVDPAEASSPRPCWSEAIRVELGRLDCAERVHELRHRITEALDPSQHGRGRTLFFGATLGSPVRSFVLQMPLETSVTLSERARLQPLLEAADAGRPAGIVVLSMAELRAIELAWGEALDVRRVPLAPPPAEWNERKEPNHVHEEDRLHILRSAEPLVEHLASARGWDRIVLAGNHRLTRPLAAKIVSQVDATVVEAMRQALPEDHVSHIADRFALHVADAGARRATDLLNRARDAALAGGLGAAGVQDVLAAVTVGRARWVAIDGDTPLSASGVRHRAGGVRVLDQTDVAPSIIERALASRAEVSVLPGSAHPQLADTGALALLRW